MWPARGDLFYDSLRGVGSDADFRPSALYGMCFSKFYFTGEIGLGLQRDGMDGRDGTYLNRTLSLLHVFRKHRSSSARSVMPFVRRMCERKTCSPIAKCIVPSAKASGA